MHDRQYSGHFLVLRVEFTPESLLVELNRPGGNLINVTFHMAPPEFDKVSQAMKIIGGEIEPGPE